MDCCNWRLLRQGLYDMTMDEEERKLEILKAETAIRELAGRMAQAIECAHQADKTRSDFEAAVNSMNEMTIECQALLESQERLSHEESKTLDRARELLESGAKDLQFAQERMEKKVEHNLASLKSEIDDFEVQLMKRTALLDSKLSDLSQEIDIASERLLFIMDQSEASLKRILALEGSITGLSRKLDGYGDAALCNSDELHELGNKFQNCDTRLSSLEVAMETKTSGFSHRLRSAIIGGGLGVILALTIVRVF